HKPAYAHTAERSDFLRRRATPTSLAARALTRRSRVAELRFRVGRQKPMQRFRVAGRSWLHTAALCVGLAPDTVVGRGRARRAHSRLRRDGRVGPVGVCFGFTLWSHFEMFTLRRHAFAFG